MVRRVLFVAFVMVAFLGLQFADCLSAMSMDEQSMQCCGSMPCHPANQSHDCCKKMTSEGAPSALPTGHSDFSISIVAVVERVPSLLEPVAPPDNSYSVTSAPQHSPPDLYTLHSSFLI